MKYFEATSGNITGSFPSTVAKQSSGAGAVDGTPLHSDYYNAFWGVWQMLMSRAGLTPSGSVEAYSTAAVFAHATPGQSSMTLANAQIMQAMQFQYGSPGELVLWCRSQAPATVGARVLLLQGQTILAAGYPDLCNAVYCGDAANNTAGVPFYLSSDSGGVTRSTSGAYLTLPDARGVTIRGIDTGATRDPLGATRGGGTPQWERGAGCAAGTFSRSGNNIIYYHVYGRNGDAKRIKCKHHACGRFLLILHGAGIYR